VVGINLFVNVGNTVYVASITPAIAVVIVLTFDTKVVTAVEESVEVLFVNVSVLPVVTTELVTAAVATSLKRTAYAPGTTYGKLYCPVELVTTETSRPRSETSP
jgi:hypothetical protein